MKKRNSRYDDEPRLDSLGKPVSTFPWAGDVVIFRLLNRYRRLPIDFIVAHTGMSYFYLRSRLDLLARKPNSYLFRHPNQHNRPKAASRYLIYENSEKAIKFLRDGALYSHEPCIGDEKLYAHSLLSILPIANIELGASSMIWWPEIASRLDKPERSIPVTISYQYKTGKETHSFDYYADSNGPFGIRYADGTARFCSLEAELTTDTKASNLKKTSFLKKILAIMYITERKLYSSAWGIPNLIHLVVCPSQDMVNSRKALILELTNGKGLTNVAFKVVPALTDPHHVPKPNPEFINEGWQRAGHPDLYLNSPTAKAAA
jgi:hypothetical protein